MIENIQQLSRKDIKHTTVVKERYKTYYSCLGMIENIQQRSIGKIENIKQLSRNDRRHTTAV